MYRIPLLLALAAGAATPAPPPHPQTIHADKAAWRDQLGDVFRTHARERADGGSALDFMAAAFLWPTPPFVEDDLPGADDQARAWFAAATEATPSDPLVDWVQASGCHGFADPCDREPAIARLLVSRWDNAAVHLLALDAAADRGDDEAVAAHLRNAASVASHRSMDLDLRTLILDAHEGIAWPPMPPSVAAARPQWMGPVDGATDEQLSATMGYVRSLHIGMPALRSLRDACRTAAPDMDAARRRDCLAVLALAAEDEVLAVQGAAVEQLAKLTEGDPEGSHWRERERRLEWLARHMVSLERGRTFSDLVEFIEDAIEHGEIPAMEATLRRHGLPTTPPEEWSGGPVNAAGEERL